MRRQDFAYELPAELIAQSPLAERAASRMLVLDAATGTCTDRRVRELPQMLRRDDLLVLNDTRVLPARAFGRKPSGGRVEIFLERALGGCEALVQLSASKPIRVGVEIATAGGALEVIARAEDLWHIRLPLPAHEFFECWGVTPLPPYIHRPPGAADRERYQSIFAREPGAVAAPTASLHFDAALLEELAARGVKQSFVTLARGGRHVPAGAHG